MFTCTADWYLGRGGGPGHGLQPAVAGLNRRYGERLLELAAGRSWSPASLAELARILTLTDADGRGRPPRPVRAWST